VLVKLPSHFYPVPRPRISASVSTSLSVCMPRKGKDLLSCLQNLFFWTDTQRAVAIPYRRDVSKQPVSTIITG